jgi:hypothetical protein
MALETSLKVLSVSVDKMNSLQFNTSLDKLFKLLLTSLDYNYFNSFINRFGYIEAGPLDIRKILSALSPFITKMSSAELRDPINQIISTVDKLSLYSGLYASEWFGTLITFIDKMNNAQFAESYTLLMKNRRFNNINALLSPLKLTNLIEQCIEHWNNVAFSVSEFSENCTYFHFLVTKMDASQLSRSWAILIRSLKDNRNGVNDAFKAIIPFISKIEATQLIQSLDVLITKWKNSDPKKRRTISEILISPVFATRLEFSQLMDCIKSFEDDRLPLKSLMQLIQTLPPEKNDEIISLLYWNKKEAYKEAILDEIISKNTKRPRYL